MYIVLILLIMGAGWWVQNRLRSKFRKYSQIGLSSGLSGAQAAQLMLKHHGIYDVQVVSVPGELTDHYNPASKTVNLSQEVYQGRSAAAVAVATHECGHAVQHAKAYSWLEFRSTLVPVQAAAGKIMNVLFILMLVGMFAFSLPYQWMLLAFIACYSVFTLFTLVTLPVEFDASKRALAWISDQGIVTSGEYDMAKDALNWAARTYLVAAIGSILTLLYYVMMFLEGE